MKIITEKRCIIGEGPIWNEKEKSLYYTNGMGGNELFIFEFETEKLKIRRLKIDVAAYAFTKDGRIIISTHDGIFILNDDDTQTELYGSEFNIQYANDMKVGPDGRIYVGTQSRKRMGVSDKIDGKLYSIDKKGNVKILLDNLILSNGLEWSNDETKFYYTDSDTGIIKEYNFDKTSGDISYTGRSIEVIGVDGFTIDQNDNLYVACWGQGYIAVVDTKEMMIKEFIEIPAKIPASCSFCGENMDILAITTASFSMDISKDTNAGYTILLKTMTKGRKPYLFG